MSKLTEKEREGFEEILKMDLVAIDQKFMNQIKDFWKIARTEVMKAKGWDKLEEKKEELELLIKRSKTKINEIEKARKQGYNNCIKEISQRGIEIFHTMEGDKLKQARYTFAKEIFGEMDDFLMTNPDEISSNYTIEKRVFRKLKSRYLEAKNVRFKTSYGYVSFPKRKEAKE